MITKKTVSIVSLALLLSPTLNGMDTKQPNQITKSGICTNENNPSDVEFYINNNHKYYGIHSIQLRGQRNLEDLINQKEQSKESWKYRLGISDSAITEKDLIDIGFKGILVKRSPENKLSVVNTNNLYKILVLTSSRVREPGTSNASNSLLKLLIITSTETQINDVPNFPLGNTKKKTESLVGFYRETIFNFYGTLNKKIKGPLMVVPLFKNNEMQIGGNQKMTINNLQLDRNDKNFKIRPIS